MDTKYDFKREEERLQRFWEEEDIYRFDGKEAGSGPVFSIDTPPPTVSGRLHIGHIFSYTQAEIIARFKRMTGYRVYYPFGFDDNGLPTERLTEKELDIRAKEMEREKFETNCLAVSERYEQEFRKLWKRLGFSADWTDTYRTVSEDTKRISQKLFLDLVRKKKAYQKESPVLWCPECRTAVAQAELETREQETEFFYLKFLPETEGIPGETICGTDAETAGKMDDKADRGVDGGTEKNEAYLPVATTRPELLCACVCVFVNPEDDRYRSFIGRKVLVPLYGDAVPVLANPDADRDKGTGAVMCATFGDMTDAQWYQEYDLPFRSALGEDGRFEQDLRWVGGKTVRAARAAVAKELEKGGELLKREKLSHSLAVHERCGKETEIRLSGQWYIDILSEKERLLKAADDINWYPSYMKKRYQIWVSGLKWDWCISRQRYFGVPFPVWYCRQCSKPVYAAEAMLPIDPVRVRPEDGGAFPDGTPKACECGCTEFVPETAVLDTWATSSVTPFLHERKVSLPMGMRSQAHEIIRTWAFYTIVRSLYHADRLPWKDIMISGFVLAKPGEKLSKSKNNSQAEPFRLIETHSADAIRYWAAGAKLGTDTFFSEADLKVSKRFLTKLWNAARFCLLQLSDFKPELAVRSGEMLPVDRFICLKAAKTQEVCRRQFEQYEIGQARQILDTFFWDDFCGDYIEIVKERLYQPEKHGEEGRRSAQTALYQTLFEILKMYAPYVPYMAEDIYQEYYREREQMKSLHLTQWGIGRSGALSAETEKAEADSLLRFGDILGGVIAGVRKEKAEAGLSMKGEVEKAVIVCPPGLVKYFRKTEQDLLACTNAGKIVYRN